MTAPLQYSYDESEDVITIEGIRYDGDVFRELAQGLALESYFQLTDRHNGCIMLRGPLDVVEVV